MSNNILMDKPLLLFAPIYDFVAQEFVDKMNDAPQDQPIDIWMNCPGGDVFAGWSIIGALQKRTGKNNLSIFGHAMSMAIYMALFCDNVEALEVTQFMIHRADAYIEDESDQVLLDNVNADLRKQMESRLNIDLLEQISGVSINDIFKSEKRIDVMLTAKQAKKLGLINSIKKLTPQEAKAYSNHFVAFADFSKQNEPKPEDTSKYYFNNQKINKMTKDELIAQSPALYNVILDEGRKLGIDAERDRVNSFLAYVEYDKENVIASVKEGKPFTTAIMAEMNVKVTSSSTIKKIQADSAPQVPTEPVKQGDEPKTEERKKIEDEIASVKAHAKTIKIY